MNIWLPPFRVCVVKRDKLLLQAFKLAHEVNSQWEVIQVETVWECALTSLNCGLHVGICDYMIPPDDLGLDQFLEFRFFQDPRLPLPLCYLKTSNEDAQSSSRHPLLKKMKSAGLINFLKSDLTEFAHDTTATSGSAHSRYILFQEEAIIRGEKYEFGSTFEKLFSEENFLLTKAHLNIINRNFDASIEELEGNINKDRHFYYAMLARLYYLKDNHQKANEYLDKFVSANTGNPFYPFVAFRIADEFKDSNYMFCLLVYMSEIFPNNYPTIMATGVWNVQHGKMSQGVLQLFSCLEKLPWDFYASGKIMQVLQKQGFHNLSTGVKNHALSMALKTKFYKQLYPQFFR